MQKCPLILTTNSIFIIKEKKKTNCHDIFAVASLHFAISAVHLKGTDDTLYCNHSLNFH